MSAWNKSLDAAGIDEPRSRGDYGAQRKLVARYKPTSYLAARLLLPPRLLPHVVAATAVMHHGDNLLDSGPRAERLVAWTSWEKRVREGLETGASDDPLIRALVHTVAAHPRLGRALEEYLGTATAELEFSGFATETDYQAYVDAYSLPAFMLVGVLLGPESDSASSGGFRAACRTLIDGSQRLDFVNDLAEDRREGRLGISAEALDRFSVPAGDLVPGGEPTGMRALVGHEVALSRAALETARDLPALKAGPGGALLTTVAGIELLTAEAVLARGPRLLTGSASPSPVRALRLLLRARRRSPKDA
ncbi:squalene/phytoene synthase family protein [Streptomyces sp. NPDC086787]|uniref:squalene/phytoene synthase family protein n=1 Tax=Streptomyces sp. NPDC086787 TaxID=3365759 RepID=UPI00380C194F